MISGTEKKIKMVLTIVIYVTFSLFFRLVFHYYFMHESRLIGANLMIRGQNVTSEWSLIVCNIDKNIISYCLIIASLHMLLV